MAIINQEKSSLPVELVYSFGGTDKIHSTKNILMMLKKKTIIRIIENYSC